MGKYEPKKTPYLDTFQAVYINETSEEFIAKKELNEQILIEWLWPWNILEFKNLVKYLRGIFLQKKLTPKSR